MDNRSAKNVPRAILQDLGSIFPWTSFFVGCRQHVCISSDRLFTFSVLVLFVPEQIGLDQIFRLECSLGETLLESKGKMESCSKD